MKRYPQELSLFDGTLPAEERPRLRKLAAKQLREYRRYTKIFGLLPIKLADGDDGYAVEIDGYPVVLRPIVHVPEPNTFGRQTCSLAFEAMVEVQLNVGYWDPPESDEQRIAGPNVSLIKLSLDAEVACRWEGLCNRMESDYMESFYAEEVEL